MDSARVSALRHACGHRAPTRRALCRLPGAPATVRGNSRTATIRVSGRCRAKGPEVRSQAALRACVRGFARHRNAAAVPAGGRYITGAPALAATGLSWLQSGGGNLQAGGPPLCVTDRCWCRAPSCNAASIGIARARTSQEPEECFCCEGETRIAACTDRGRCCNDRRDSPSTGKCVAKGRRPESKRSRGREGKLSQPANCGLNV